MSRHPPVACAITAAADSQQWIKITDAAMHEKPAGFPGFKVSPGRLPHRRHSEPAHAARLDLRP